jgi:hypothetical protein
MAKRQRGTSARPGQRPPATRGTTRPATRPTVPVRPANLTDEELERADALEAAVVEEERQAAASLARNRERRRSAASEPAPRVRTRAGGALQTIAADEYLVVRHDLRRIVAVFGLIFGLLLVAYLAVSVLGIAAAPPA